jgi:hypothetical protein
VCHEGRLLILAAELRNQGQERPVQAGWRGQREPGEDKEERKREKGDKGRGEEERRNSAERKGRGKEKEGPDHCKVRDGCKPGRGSTSK